MRRATAAAILLFTSIAAVQVQAACQSVVREVPRPEQTIGLLPGPVVWTGTTLAVVSHDRSTKAIWLSIHSETGETLVPAFRVTESSLHGPLGIFWTGTELALFYTASGSLWMQRFTDVGVLNGGPVKIGIDASVRLGDEFAIAWSSGLDAFVMGRTVTFGRRGAWITTLERDGSIRGDIGLIIPAATKPDFRVAASDAPYAGVFYRSADTGEIVYVRMDASATRRIVRVLPEAEDLRVAAHQGDFVLIRTAETDDDGLEIRALRIDFNGDVVIADHSLISGPGDEVRPVAILSAGDELAVSYLDAEHGFDELPPDYRLRRIGPSWTTLSDTLFAAALPLRARAVTASNFAWTGTAYVSPAAREFSARIDLYLLTYCPLRASVEHSLYVRQDDPVTFSLSVDGGVPGYSYDWSFGDRNESDEMSPTHAYRFTGAYPVIVVVTDATGTTYTVETVVNVVVGKQRAARR